uniref:D12 class N6 adenine-specific DNA methyltransferase n=1 Tax=Candidatus Kentrum sp. TC TaxID=2126339 RepID=A0A451AGJ5_9GAMM|nr:MAG: D12 class N6 adenine-specific DNA methyltransferase [Candidatus Kentron sp. TC]
MTAPIFPYPGGKRRLAKKILPLFPKHTCYLEAFVGAGAILLAKEPSKAEVMNDLNGELINFFRMVRHHPKALNDELKWMLPSRMDFEQSKAVNPESLRIRPRVRRPGRKERGFRVDGGGSQWGHRHGDRSIYPERARSEYRGSGRFSSSVSAFAPAAPRHESNSAGRLVNRHCSRA